MATLTPLIPTKPQIFSTSSLHYVNNPIKIRITNYPSIRRSNFKFPLKSSRLPLNFPLQSSRNSRVSACFNRPTSRRKNYLRKKLIEQQVSQIPTVDSDPILEFDDIDDFVSKMGNLKVFDSVDASASGNIQEQVLEFDDINDSLPNLDGFHSVEVPKSGNLQNPAHEFDDNDEVMLNQLKSWVDQYEADTGFWGTGSSPIFTIFQDSDGKVKKVDIDEDEILRRSQIEPSMYKLEAVEDVKEVNSKISHAKFLAKEMEKGKNVLPANSSVAKFVNSSENSDFRDTVQGFACNPGLDPGNDVLPTNSSVEKFVNSSEKLGFLDTIRGFACNPGLVPKLSKVGIAAFFGFLVLFTLKSLFAGRKKEEDYSSLEKEMLRRKVKARMAKEKLVKGSVEVVQDPKEPEVVFAERPRLDKEELMKTIVDINASNGDSVDINSKIQEIRVMARHARETERTDALASKSTSSNENSETVRNRPSDLQGDAIGTLNGTTRAGEGKIEISDVSKLDVPKDDVRVVQVVENKRSNILDTEKVPKKNSDRAKPRIIKSVEEAREYLSKKQLEKQEKIQEAKVTKSQEVAMDPKLASDRSNSGSNEGENFSLSGNGTVSRNVSSYDAAETESGDVMSKNVSPEDDREEHGKGGDGQGGELGKLNRQKWMEDNFQEFEPIVEIKARMVKEKLVKGSLEVVQDPKEPEIVFAERPRLDKEELMKTIVDINASNGDSVDISSKIQEIRVMARHARETERTDALANNSTSSNENSETVGNRPSDPQGDAIGTLNGTTRAGESKIENSDVSKLDVLKDDVRVAQVVENKRSNILDTEKVPKKNSDRAKPRIIKSVEEAREYLSKKQHEKQEKTQEAEVTKSQEVAMDPKLASDRSNSGSNEGENFNLSGNGTVSRNVSSYDAALRESGDVMSKNVSPEDDREEHGKGGDGKGGELGKLNRQKWMEDNFQEFEPIVEKIRAGFRDNYMVARKEVKEDLNIVSQLKLPDEGDELEWMKDEKLRDIVFQVRENELMGRDPFYLMDAEDRSLFFKGLEKKVEKENEKLRDLHQYLHSNIENLDYGADGISVYDPPEKIIPRWKGPPPTTAATPEFLNEYMQQREALFAETFGNSSLVKKDPQDLLHNANQKAKNGNLKSSKTVIEGSDGSIKPGKKSGKEFWQHTKKWSREFLECYNAETDPETKDMMKDIGKDLNRWLTKKEIQEAADIMDKVPKKRKKFINERLNKVKREMELFGPHAVVNKYSEYAEEEEVDYYWWLDLPCVLCIELYMDGDGDGDGDGERNIGFYSLEMAADLELDPKPHHVIAFEDTGDCKNFCYILQAHLEMIGKGNAFIVPQSPKDAYREAKANGFNVTVIRKGEMKLNVDQTLEEVEEQITEIGSKMYHDQIMKGRNVGMESLMKGVFGPEKSTKRRSKKLKKPTK